MSSTRLPPAPSPVGTQSETPSLFLSTRPPSHFTVHSLTLILQGLLSIYIYIAFLTRDATLRTFLKSMQLHKAHLYDALTPCHSFLKHTITFKSAFCSIRLVCFIVMQRTRCYMKQPVRAATGLNIMHIEALHMAVELAWLCLGSWLHSC